MAKFSSPKEEFLLNGEKTHMGELSNCNGATQGDVIREYSY